MLQFDVCCKAIDQNFNCGCDRCAILCLDSLMYRTTSIYGERQLENTPFNSLVWDLLGLTPTSTSLPSRHLSLNYCTALYLLAVQNIA